MTLALLSILLSVATGFALLVLLAPAWVRSALLLALSLSTGIGLGISSCLFTLWLYIVGSPGRGIGFMDVGLLAVLGGFGLRKVMARPREPLGSCGIKLQQQSNAYIAGPFVFCLITALLRYGRIAHSLPHGGWDAWAIWNLHARMLFRGGPSWKQGFSGLISWSHPDYPLLIPAIVARSWTYWERDSVLVPSLVATLFTLATAAIVISGLAILRGKFQALMGGTILLATPFFLTLGAWQYADVPLSFFMVTSLALVALAERDPTEGYGLRVLAGTCAGLAVWTKNEGWVFALSLALAQLLTALFRVRRNREAKQVLLFLAGFAPIAGVDLLFKVTVAPANYMFGPNQPSILHRLGDFSRYSTIAAAFWLDLFRFGEWRGLTHPSVIRGDLIVLLAIYAVLAGLHGKREWRPIQFVLSLSIVLTALGYFAAYVITPEDVRWQLATSLNRLLLQLWPSLVFLIFLIIRDPTFTEAPSK